MQIVFKKIPRLAIYFYLIGFIVITTALIFYFNSTTLINHIQIQQLFIAGAIVVAIGSVINNLSHFKRKKHE